MPEILLLGDFWEWNVGWETLDGDTVAGGLRVGDEDLVTPVVLK